MKAICFVIACFMLSSCATNMSGEAKRNERYLNEQLKNHPHIVSRVHDTKAFKEKLVAMQTSPEVCQWIPEHGVGITPLYYGEEGIKKLKESHLIRIALMLDRIKGEKFTRKIGALIEADLADARQDTVVAAEIAGFGLLVEHGIELLPVHSEYGMRLNDEKLVYNKVWYDSREDYLESINNSHTMPDWAYNQIPNVFHFHMHAVPGYLDYEQCGPGFSIISSVLGSGDDITHARVRAWENGEYHGFVFSSFGDKRYGIHYFGAGIDPNNEVFAVVVNLPTQSYSAD